MDKAVELAANQELPAKLTHCQQEVEVLRSELELSTAILNTVDAIALVFDSKGHIIRCNSSFEQITGYTLNEVKNQPFWDLCNQNQRESVKAVFERVQQDKTALAKLNEVIAHAHDWLTKNGSRRRIAWDYTHVLNSDGTLKYVIGTGSDITEYQQIESESQRLHEALKMQVQQMAIAREQEQAATERVAELAKANEELRQEQVQLRQSEARYRQVVENAPISIAFISADGCASEGNRAFEQMYGMTIAQLKQQNFNIFTGPQLVENVTLHYMQRALAGETVIEPATSRYDAGQTVVGGNFLRGQGHYLPIRDGLGRVQEIVEICPDVTALYKAQQALLEAEQARSQALERHNRELQQTLDRLAESQHRYRTLFELSNEGIYRFEFEQPISISLPLEEQFQLIYQHWRLAEANNTYAIQYGGTSPDDLIGMRMPKYAIDSEKSIAANRAVLENGYQLRNAEAEETINGQQRFFLHNLVSDVRNGYFFGGWGMQTDITELRETQEALLQKEQARSAELEKVNEALKRSLDSLASEPSLDKFLGQVLGAIAEQFDSLLVEYWYHAPENTAYVGMISWQGQIYSREEITQLLPNHPGIIGFCVPADMINGESLYQRKQYFIVEDSFTHPTIDSEAWGDDWKKVFIDISKEINVPMVLEDNCIGALIVRMSREQQITTQQIELAQALAHQATLAVQLTRLAEEAKLAAIAREQELAATERAAELAKANEALKQTVDVLATEADLNRFLGHVLKVIADQLDAPLTEYWFHPEPDNIAYVGLTYWQGQILLPEQQPGHPSAIGFPVLPELIGQESLHHRRGHFVVEDLRTSSLHAKVAAEYGIDAGAWYEVYGVSRHLNVPLILGDKTIGALIVFLPEERHFTSQQIELAYALAQQVTLAIQLTRLAEEAKLAAIAREQELAAQERAAELAKANEALKRSLDILATDSDLTRFIGHVLKVAAECLGSFLTEYWWTEPEPRNIVHIGSTYFQGQILTPEEQPGHPGLGGLTIKPETIHYENLHHRKRYFVREDILSDPFFDDYAAESSVDVRGWYLARGIRKELNIPLNIGETSIGALCVYLPVDHQFTEQQIELAYALAQQVTLAIQLTRLAEEAKLAAIAREQERAATERAAELTKINAALQVEVIARSQAEQLARGQTEALIKILAGLAVEPNLDSFLGNALRAIAEQLAEQSAGLWLYDDAHDATILHLNYESGTVHRGAQTNRPAASIHHPLKGWDVEYLAALRQQKVLIHTEQEFASPGYATSRASYCDRGIKTVLYVSLFFGDHFLGFITIRSTQTRHYQSKEIELARALAQQATLAIQLTHLAEQSRQTAVLEERNRMARDIHDTLAQSFTGIILQLEATKSLPNSNCLDIHISLDCIGELARLGLAEARRSVRALRLEALETADFSTALRRLLHQATNGTSIHATLAIEGTAKPLPLNLEENLLRIAQEALTNAIRHGHANTITLQLLFEPTTVHLHITDDGNGFDPCSTPFSGFGLLGMQERTDQLNGQFHLVSQPGQGTEITVSVPI